MSNKIYTTVPVPKFPRNIFSLSRPVIGSMRMQKCYPTEILEVVPGDAFNVSQETFLRTAPLVAPPLAKVTLNHHAFFVPAWQLHHDFDDFITGGEKMDYTDHMPYCYVCDIAQWVWLNLGILVKALTSAENYNALYELLGTTRWDYFESHLMDDTVAFMEMFDYSRAVPFSMPEFQPLQAVDKNGYVRTFAEMAYSDFTNDPTFVASLLAIAQANLDSFTDINPMLSGLQFRINLLPFYAYLKVWCEYFRDENLVDNYWDELKDSAFFTSTDYLDISPKDILYTDPDPEDYDQNLIDAWIQIVHFFCVKARPWKKDRFTSALPWTQKGPDVVIPLSGQLPLEVNKSKVVPASSSSLGANNTSGGLYLANGGAPTSLVGTADLSKSVGLSTMRDLRRAEAVEEFAEADGRFGNRYPENTLGQFGVYTPDSRLPRAQFLGSSQQIVSFGEIAQTSETNDTPLGTLAGKGSSYNPSFLFKKRFTMHGYVVIFTSIQVQALYEQGIHPMFSRFDRTEYAWPRYARLGEEPVYEKEISVFGENVEEDTVFGYAPRYSTYKSDTGSVHGQMKSTLSYWTFSRRFAYPEDPKLNQEFIYNPPRTDAFAVTNPYAEQFYFEIDWKIRSSRLLPFYGIPSI